LTHSLDPAPPLPSSGLVRFAAQAPEGRAGGCGGQQQTPITKDRITDRTLEPPIRDAACTGRAFIISCCTASVTEFLVNAQLWLAGSVAGHGWTKPWPGSIDDINETGTLVDANRTERPIHWRPTPDNMNE
jgi:hypothetical protein